MKVSEKKWHEVADNLKRRREENPITPNIELYKKIVSMVHIGKNVMDVGAGQCHLEKALKYKKVFIYHPLDPFPLNDMVSEIEAENIPFEFEPKKYDTVFMLAALDNVLDVELALKGLKHVASENIVILTGIEIEPDQYHTHKITRQMLIDVLGEPSQEVEMLPKVFLFEWKL